MRTTFGFAAIASAASLAAISAPLVYAQDSHPPAASVSLYGDPSAPDISGLWLGSAMGVPGVGAISNSGGTADGRPPVFWAPWPLPYTPAYQKIYDERVASVKRGRALGDIGSQCLPFGLPSVLASIHYPDEIVETQGAVTIFTFATFPLVIWTDGRTHPATLTPSYNGHSIGHWVGDTLYVDTVGIKDTTPIDSNTDPHSAKLHMVWTVRRVAPDVLHIHLTLYDDEAFMEPVTMTNIWHRKSGAEWQVLDDQSCFENNQNVAAPATAAGFIKF